MIIKETKDISKQEYMKRCTKCGAYLEKGERFICPKCRRGAAK